MRLVRVVVAMFALAAIGAVALAVPAVRTQLAGLGQRADGAVGINRPEYQAAAQAAPPLPTLHDAPVSIDASTVFFGWALLDRKTGQVTGSANYATGTNTTESMIKAGIVSDYLRFHDSPTDAVLGELKLAIIDSNDDMAQKYYKADGGNAVIDRVIKICQLPHTTTKSGWWSMTQMTPQDAVTYGRCVADGTLAGPKWTPWVLQAMQQVRGTVEQQPASQKTGGGRWGIIDALPWNLAPQAAIKNGWTFIFADGLWHVNCLAILPDHVLAVMMRYKAANSVAGLKIGDNICASVTRQLVYAPEL
jgi:hypothetical protein